MLKLFLLWPELEGWKDAPRPQEKRPDGSSWCFLSFPSPHTPASYFLGLPGYHSFLLSACVCLCLLGGEISPVKRGEGTNMG